ncbi:hypothetical protein NIES4073_39380 [Kalymmatonema gypsitolerans NIES-4073]|nr:hypothetical protein NIES4073_39380 [Scytonema sp. NIES-4073]
MNNNTLAQLNLSAVKEINDEVAATCSGGVARINDPDPDVTLYADGQLRGGSLRVNASVGDGIPNIGTNGSFNDRTSSLVIHRGQWEFFADSGYRGRYSRVLGPGLYRSLDATQISNDQLTGLRRVG